MTSKLKFPSERHLKSKMYHFILTTDLFFSQQICRTIVWADYLATSVDGSTIAEIEAEDRLAGAVVNTSPLAASIAAAAAAAAAGDAPVTSDQVSQAASIVDPAVAAASASKFFEKDTLSLYPDQGPLSEWDLRAAMEKRRRMERERDEWLAKKEHKVGRYRAIASDWRNDVRIKDTGDPTQPNYREWSLREIWDLITLGGAAVDPRTLAFRVESPTARTDFVAEGFYQHPEVPEFLAMQGRLIEEDNEAEVVDADAEALLASEFSDLDDFPNDPLVDASTDESF